MMTKSPSSLRVLGLDPGFASVGWAVLHVGDGSPECVGAGVFRTSRDSSVAKNEDTLKRIERIAEFLNTLKREHKPHLIGSEGMSWTRFANADRSVAFFWGVLGAFSSMSKYRTRPPIVQTTPSDLKMIITGKKSASKEEVKESTCKQVSNLRHELGKIRAKTQRNHASDAAAAGLAALSSPIGRLVSSMAGNAHFDFYNNQEDV
jgi:crossover junction endodeoxyribonuclease RuvC